MPRDPGSTTGPPGEDTASAGVGQRLLALGPPQHCQTYRSWLTTCALAQREQPWRNWPGWPEPVGPSECFEEAKGEVGLDEYEVRRGWLVPAHNAGDAGPCLSDSNQTSGTGAGGKGGHYGLDEELIPLTVPEVRRLLTRLVWTERQPPDLILYWSWWRRRHQATAQRCHYNRRLPKVRL